MNSSSPVARSSRSRNLLGVLSFLKPYKASVTLAVGMLLVNIGLEMTLPRVSGTAINQMHHAIDTGTPYLPWTMAGLFVGLALLRSALGFTMGRLRNRLVQATLKDIRSTYFDAVQRLSFAYHDKTNTGELISRGTSDINRLQEFLFACLFLGIDIAVAMVVTIILIAWISPICGLITLVTLVSTVSLIVYCARQLHAHWRKTHDLNAEMTTTIQENIAGVRVVKAFARERDEVSKFRGRRDAFVAQFLATVNYWAGRVPMAQFIFGLSMPLVLWIGGRQVIAHEMPIGNLAMIVFYLMGIGNRMVAVGQFVNIIQTASASAERVMEVLEDPLKIQSGTKSLFSKGGADVTFENVSFGYAKGTGTQLQEVSFVAKSGQTVAIVGATGSGKSTLVHLIPRFYDPTSGCVRIDGVDVREYELSGLRKSVGMIFQETILFSATVSNNIAYGRPNATQAEIVAAARAAHAHEFIARLDHGYDTVIGERGVSLSGGQKQRLAIARAFLLDPRILILDDATSSLDSKTERLIQEDMRRVCLGRTAFVIAHRLTTLQHADHVIVLREGRIVEQGGPQELMEHGACFKELFRRQGIDRSSEKVETGGRS
jgi:ATP-binding cassette subfamily B protein